jgi:hypothetical protein
MPELREAIRKGKRSERPQRGETWRDLIDSRRRI